MQIEELKKFGIKEKYVQKFKEEKILKLYPYQEEVVRKKLIAKNYVLSIPTAAGKTLVATLSIIKTLERGKKVVYVVPLVALAFEKYNYFKKFFDDYKVAISVGDYDQSDPWLARYDLIICTTEKFDSLIRHGINWIDQVGLIVVDEIHLLNDSSRGPTLEILIARLKKLIPKAQLIALSATIKNCKELADWLKAKLIESNFRPVKLYEGVAYPHEVKFFEKHPNYKLSTSLELEASIVENTLRLRKQALFFVATRRRAESLAKNLAKIIKPWLGKNEENLLKKLANEVENVLEIPTKQCKELANCVRRGVAFHHAGLLSRQKRLIEESFRNGLIKIIVATPTLAMGVNIPAFRVIVRDAKRYYPGIGSIYIPVLEYKQFVGRAGRPTWDTFGESILIAKSENDAEDLAEKFIFGELEEIRSKLSYEPLLRMHILALIASEFVKSKKELHDFFQKTFFYFQYGDLSYIEDKIEFILDQLKDWRFIKIRRNKLIATKLGKRVSELYLDPLTANYFVECLGKVGQIELKNISFLQVICNSFEMYPLLNVSLGETKDVVDYIIKNERYFLQKIPDEWDLDYDRFLRSVKTAMCFEAWVNEKTEDEILTRFRIAPGELRSKIQIADWLLYSLHELALLLGKKQVLTKIRKLRIRMSYGIKEELIPLVKLEGVGRVRARRLYNAGLRRLSDLRKIPLESLAELIGEKTAVKIKKQLGEKISKREEIQKTLK
jgi:helicase